MNRKICNCFWGGFFIALVLFIGYMIGIGRVLLFPIYMVINLTYPSFLEPYAMHLGYIGIFILMFLNMFIWSVVVFSIFYLCFSNWGNDCNSSYGSGKKK